MTLSSSSAPSSADPSAAALSDALRFRNLRLLALRTEHASLAVRLGDAIAYRPDIGPWAALTSDDQLAWDDLRWITDRAEVERASLFPPDGWQLEHRSRYLLMVGTRPDHVGDLSDVRVLGEPDLPGMERIAAAIGATMFSPGAFALGRFRGVFDGDELVSMAGTRGSTADAREIVAVATLPDRRGEGHAARVVSATKRAIEASGRTAYLQVDEENATAVRLYERIGFEVHHTVFVDTVRARVQ
jgi:ribosomal protein S18 acetylase RimI-like enzyme